MPAGWVRTRGTWPPLKNIKIAVECSGVARSIEPEGLKGPRRFLGDMDALGPGQGALPPNPLNTKRADFSGVPRMFGLEGSYVTQVFSCGEHGCFPTL